MPKNKKFVEHIEYASRRRLINGEYQRGFLEGQQAAAKELAVLVDTIMARFDHIAAYHPVDWQETENYKQE